MSLVFQKILVGYNFQERWSTEHNRKHLHVWEEYKNLCIKKISRGDDLYMIVWDTENECPKEVIYGSTSVKSFSKFSSYEDATPDILLKYEQWKEVENSKLLKIKRSTAAKKLIELRCNERLVLLKSNISQRRLRQLYDLLGYDKYLLCLTLLQKRFRTELKVGLQNKLTTYLYSDKTNYPFSFKEWNTIRSIL